MLTHGIPPDFRGGVHLLYKVKEKYIYLYLQVTKRLKIIYSEDILGETCRSYDISYIYSKTGKKTLSQPQIRVFTWG